MDYLEGNDSDGFYIKRIGLFYFFSACAGVSIIVWVLIGFAGLINVVVVIFFTTQLIKE